MSMAAIFRRSKMNCATRSWKRWQAGSLIGHVQLGDSNRLEPGAGHYDWPETLEALEAIGYEGWLAMECGLSGPVDQILPEVADLLSR